MRGANSGFTGDGVKASTLLRAEEASIQHGYVHKYSSEELPQISHLWVYLHQGPPFWHTHQLEIIRIKPVTRTASSKARYTRKQARKLAVEPLRCWGAMQGLRRYLSMPPAVFEAAKYPGLQRLDEMQVTWGRWIQQDRKEDSSQWVVRSLIYLCLFSIPDSLSDSFSF